jgi:hypothetical protein
MREILPTSSRKVTTLTSTSPPATAIEIWGTKAPVTDSSSTRV